LIPDGFDFGLLPGLSNELKQKMRERCPRSVADAQRIEGMTPAAIALIIAHVRSADALKGAA
jgi:tRNA uridine 5-carboxymethylaminomethyl modification enzyme